jgi:hypothetical protein
MLLGTGNATDGSEKIRQLLAQKERLLGEISNEERHEAAELAHGRRRTVEAEEQEKEHREAAFEEQTTAKLAEAKLAWPEAASAAKSLAAAAISGLLGGKQPLPTVLLEEVRAAREELASVRSVRSDIVQAKAASDRQRLENWIAKIRAGSQENQALQANQQMAQAHLKALEAMAASSSTQVQVREAALQALLKQLEDEETIASAMRSRAEVAENSLEASEAELRYHEAVSHPASWANVRINEHEELKRERDSLFSEVRNLKEQAEKMQDNLERSRQSLCPDDELRTSIANLRYAYEAAASTSYDALCRPSMLEAEVARLSTQLLSDKKMELGTCLHSAERHLKSVNGHIPSLYSETSFEESAAGEAEALRSALAARQADCECLRVKGVEHEEEFRTIMRDLQEQIAYLHMEKREEELQSMHIPKDTTALRLAQHTSAYSSAPFGSHRATPVGGSANFGPGRGSNSILSAAPGALVDPGRGSEPPPRRSVRSRSEATLRSAGAETNTLTRQPPTPTGNYRHRHPGMPTSSRNQPLSSWPDLAVDRRARPHSPSPASRLGMETDQTLLMPGQAPGRVVGGSIDSYLFHTHNASGLHASASLDSNMFRTPLASRPQQISPMATTLRRRPDPFGTDADVTAGHAFEIRQSGQGKDTAASSILHRRARTPPPIPPSMSSGLLAEGLGEEVRSGRTAQADGGFMPMASHFASANERRTAFQARIAELKGVIGSSLHSLDEEEARDGHRWRHTRSSALAAREEALYQSQAMAAQEIAAAVRGGLFRGSERW